MIAFLDYILEHPEALIYSIILLIMWLTYRRQTRPNIYAYIKMIPGCEKIILKIKNTGKRTVYNIDIKIEPNVKRILNMFKKINYIPGEEEYLLDLGQKNMFGEAMNFSDEEKKYDNIKFIITWTNTNRWYRKKHCNEFCVSADHLKSWPTDYNKLDDMIDKIENVFDNIERRL